MSSVIIAGNTSGTITLDAPNVAGTTVLTLPTANGTVLTTANTFAAGTGPAFSANTATTQSISNATYTKVTLGTEVFDTNSNFASSTFTPTVAGYYQINAGIFYNTSATTGLGQIYIYKNGSAVNGTVSNMSAAGYCGLSIATLTYCNGSTDYIELYTYHAFGTAQNVSSGNTVFMTGAMVRSA
jgi:hypothetical protein